MIRLRSLIKEVLSQPKKKDCGCGCNDCGGKAPILTENKVKHLISEGLQYHMDKKIQLHESVYRIGSEKHFALINEARKLWTRGLIDVSEDDQAILETHLGNFGLYETVNFEGEEYDIVSKDGDWVYLRSIHDTQVGRKEIKVKEKDITINEAEVPLDLPMVNEEKDRAKEIIRDLFGLDFEFDYTYKPEGNKIVIGAEGYNPDGTLFDMKDVHKEKIIRTFRDKMSNAVAKPNMGGGITVFLKESLNEGQDKWVVYDTKTKKRLPNAGKIYKDKKAAQAFADKQENAKVASDIYYADNIQESSLEERINTILEAKKKAKSKKKDPPLNKPKRGGSKAYYVYVRDPKTKKIKKVSFGSGGLRAKIKNKEARNAFAARHNCKNKKDRTKAGYWSCNLPRYAEQLGLGSKMNTFW